MTFNCSNVGKSLPFGTSRNYPSGNKDFIFTSNSIQFPSYITSGYYTLYCMFGINPSAKPTVSTTDSTNCTTTLMLDPWPSLSGNNRYNYQWKIYINTTSNNPAKFIINTFSAATMASNGVAYCMLAETEGDFSYF